MTLRVADLACGTGISLKATLQTIVDNYVRACAEQQLSPDLKHLHQTMVQDSLWGFDVIPFAIHLAASAIATHEPDATFGNMNLFTMPLGGGRTAKTWKSRLPSRPTNFGSGRFVWKSVGLGRVTGGGEVHENVTVPPLDLCAMNPPFTRSVGGNLLFGNAPKRQRAECRRSSNGLSDSIKSPLI